MRSLFLAVALIAVSKMAVAGQEDVYTLYRSSLVDPKLRVHVATFDAYSGREYNAENCLLAARLFVRQPGTQTVFWCEPGRFKASK